MDSEPAVGSVCVTRSTKYGQRLPAPRVGTEMGRTGLKPFKDHGLQTGSRVCFRNVLQDCPDEEMIRAPLAWHGARLATPPQRVATLVGFEPTGSARNHRWTPIRQSRQVRKVCQKTDRRSDGQRLRCSTPELRRCIEKLRRWDSNPRPPR